MSKTQQRKAFKKKKMVEEALGQAAPRKLKVKKEPAQEPASNADENAQKETSKRKAEHDQHEATAKASPKKQKLNGRIVDQKEANFNAKSDTKTTREPTKTQHTKTAPATVVEVDTNLSIGQGTNRSNYVSVLSADGPDTYTAASVATTIATQPIVAPKPNPKKAKNVSEVTVKAKEQPPAKAINTTNAAQADGTISKTQQKKLARQQRQQAKEDAAVENVTQPKTASPAPTKKVNEKQKKLLQAVRIFYFMGTMSLPGMSPFN
jgi:hypothetical protein